MMIPSLYDLCQKALDDAFALRCLSLLEDVKSYPNIPTPIEQNKHMTIVKKII